ncbi:MAG TPA: PAS domain S-box protein, partial [Thermoplasmatales archaeon]|nr:PAS domain S-box protein [Thermoplasmatales archaeon]
GFEESRDQLFRNAKCFGWDLKDFEEKGLLTVSCVYPAEKLLEEHLRDTLRVIKEKNIKRCVIDSLSALSNHFEKDVLSEFSVRLNGFLKNYGVTTLLTATTGAVIGSSNLAEGKLSSVTDNIVMLRYVEMQGKLESVIHVLKVRGSDHDRELRRYEITSSGLTIDESLTNYEGVMTGVSKKIAELKKESEELKKALREKEEAEKQLRENEKRLRVILDNLQAGVLIIDAETHEIVEVNSFASKIIGLPKEEITGNICHTFVCSAQRGNCPITDLGENIDNSKRVLITKDRGEIPILKTANLVTLNDHPYIIESFVDISDLVDAENALKESEERFKQFSESAPVYCYMVAPDGRILDINQHALDALGYKDKEEVIGKKIIPTVYPSSQHTRAKELVKKWLREGKLRNEEIEIISHGGTRTVLLSVDDVRDEEGNLLYSILIQRDVTDLKEAEDALHRSKKEMEDILNAAADAIRIIGRDFKIKRMNKTMEELAGVSMDEAKDLHCWEMLKAEGLCKTKECSLLKALETGERFSREATRVRRDGTLIHTLEVVTPYRDEQGEIVGIIEDFRDITEIKKTENALRESEERFRMISQLAGDIIWEVDNNWKYTFITGRVKDILGYEPMDILGRSLFDLLSGNETEVKESFLEAAKSLNHIKDLQYKSLTRDGREVWLSTSALPIVSENGILTGYRGIHKDVTKQKEMENQINEYTSRFKVIFHNMVDPVVIVDAKGKILEVSSTVEKVTGYDREELIGRNFLILPVITPRSKMILIKNLMNRMMGRELQSYEVTIVTKNGEKLPYEVNASRIIYDGKTADLVVFRRLYTTRDAYSDDRISKEYYYTMFDYLPQKIFEKDKNLVYTYVNKVFADSFGFSPEDIVGKTDFDIYPREIAERWQTEDKRVLESGQPEEFIVEELVDGKQVEVHCVRIPVFDENGGSKGILGMIWSREKGVVK